MDRVEIPCPQCGKLLVLPDRTLLGKRGKCPRCAHRFSLVAPTGAVQFQEAAAAEGDEPTAAEAPPGFHSEPVGAARDAAGPSRPGPSRTLGGEAPPGKSRQDVPPTDASASPAPRPAAPDAGSVIAGPVITGPGEGWTEPEAIPSPTVVKSGAGRHRRRSGGRRAGGWIVAALLMAVVGGGAVWWASQQPTARTKKSPRAAAATAPRRAVGDDEDPTATAATDTEPSSPTEGPPLKLKYIPLGARMVIHLRPAELWADTDLADEFRACLGPLVPALESRLQELSLFPPSALESVLLAFIPKSRDEFEIAVVARTKADFKRSLILEKINGELVNSPKPHFVGPQRVFLVPDNRTVVSAPRGMVETFLEAADRPLDASEGLETILSHSDSLRHLTVVAELEDLRNGIDTLVPERARRLLLGVIDFLGDNVETVGWSFHLTEAGAESRLFNEVVVRNQTTRSAGNLARDLRKQLDNWPREMLDLVRMMRPETTGHARVVGRFPAMTQVVAESVWENHTQRLVTFRSDLPALAAPNLAAGSLLAWDYASRPGMGKGGGSAPSESGAGRNLSIADRLRKPISVDFRNEFLFKALEFIEGEIGVKIRTDGPGMQRVGVTQNMRQDLQLENTPASEILFIILEKNLKDRELCLWIDEANSQAVVTSRVVAEEQKRPIFPLRGK